MNISEALNAAADHIEQHPDSYNFFYSLTPHKSEQACMLGRFAHLAGIPAGTPVDLIAFAVLRQHPQDFYADICRAAGVTDPKSEAGNLAVTNPQVVPNALRKVAGKFQGIPETVLDIFKSSPFMLGRTQFIERLVQA